MQCHNPEEHHHQTLATLQISFASEIIGWYAFKFRCFFKQHFKSMYDDYQTKWLQLMAGINTK
jgi:hypothetical protein